ncbi:MAG TPA: cupredoxin domain-containing protein [Polyangiaceae bacterium]|jgi:plastocyanin domain-containing protein
MKLTSCVLLALVLGSSALLGCKSGGDASSSSSSAPSSGPVQVEANTRGFTPASVAVKKGAPVTLVFKRTTDDTCATEVVFPELKITKPLPLNTPVSIEIPAGEPRTLTFQCGMGMFKGKVIVS